jgi:hypothetical protein
LTPSTAATGSTKISAAWSVTTQAASQANKIEVAARRFFFCYPASVGVLGFEHDSRDEPIIHLWSYRG